MRLDKMTIQELWSCFQEPIFQWTCFRERPKCKKQRERVSLYEKTQNYTQDIQTGAFSHSITWKTSKSTTRPEIVDVFPLTSKM